MKLRKRVISVILAGIVCAGIPVQARGAEAEDTEKDYVVWDLGRGVTLKTAASGQDHFETYESGITLQPAGQNEQVENYYLKNGGEEVFGAPAGMTYITNTGILFREYEKAMIVTGNYGTYSIRLPLLNVFAGGGGIESFGAPLGEQVRSVGETYQTFEKGTLRVSGENITDYPDTLCVRRDNLYYFKYTISGGEADRTVGYGRADDLVLAGDWNGDAVDTLCVRRGNLYYFKNNLSGGEADAVIAYGRPEDQVYVGDWDGDGVDTLCVRRGNLYYFQNSLSGGEADRVIAYGRPEDQVLVGDWNGDGVDTLCVRRDNLYYIQNSFAGGEADTVLAYGRAEDTVLVGDWNGDELDTLCVRRDNLYYFKNTISGGEADDVLAYGKEKDTVYAGNWRGADGGEKLEIEGGGDLSFNQSRGFQYSRLSRGFAGNAVNSVSFRKNALATYIDPQGNETQYCAYYDYSGNIVLAKRQNGGDWEYCWTGFQGEITDAHNSVSIAVDGSGYLHMAWSMHAGALNYAVADQPGSLSLRRAGMVGRQEDMATYPEFYVQPSGDMFFLYRNGSSGNGNLVLNHYDTGTGTWTRLHDDLISGEGQRSPYWQACVDSTGRLHISWVWRETEDVSTNYNLLYAVSTDATGTAFENSRGEEYSLPVTEATGETICQIPQGSALINQTSMTVDGEDLPYIISYWRVEGVVQYNIIRYTDSRWIVYNTNIRSTDFELTGGGTRQLPCARPQILVRGSGDETEVCVFFRDEERESRASAAKLIFQGGEMVTEEIMDITAGDMGEWEPVYDISLWQKTGKIQLFMQNAHYRPDGSGSQYEMEYIYVADVTQM